MTLVPSSSHPSSGGGGFTVGSSYLTAHAADLNNQADGAFLFYTWTLGYVQPQGFPTSAGSDIAIDAMDATKLNILTTGWYELAVEGLTANPDTPTDSGVLVVSFAFASGNLHTWGVEQFFSPGNSAGITGCQDNLATGQLRMAAGEVISAQIGVGLVAAPANTWSAAGPDLTITRLS